MIGRGLERALAVGATVLVPLALRLLPLPAVFALCDRWPRVALSPRTPAQLANRVRRWLAHRRGPWTSSCLTRSLVLYALLRQHGYQPRFVVGVAGTAHDFDAHAWVTLDDTPVADPPDVSGAYTPLLSHCG
jgi:hypothetical protein